MDQSYNQPNIICPSCKSENPDISVCLTCGSKIQRPKLNTKDLISRPGWLTYIAGVYALMFIRTAYVISFQKNELAIVVQIIFAIIYISIAYGLWKLKKWAWIVVVISCCLTIMFLWTNPIVLWLNPSVGFNLAHKSFYNAISGAPLLQERFTSMAIKTSLGRAIIGSIIPVLILTYFFSNNIRNIFSNNPVIWKDSTDDPFKWRITRD